jgi:signal transduction histidine kinase
LDASTRAGILDRTHQPAGWFEAAARAGLRLTAIRSRRRLLADCVDLIRETFGLDSVVVYLLDDDKERIAPQAVEGEPGESLPVDDSSPIGRAVQQQTAIHTPASADSSCAELALPLTFAGPLGALALRARQTSFAPDEIAACQILADQLAIALHNVQRYTRDAQVLASAERRAMMLEAATQVGRDVTSILELDTLLERIVDTICLAYGFYYAAVFLVDTKMQRWAVLRAGYGEAGRKLLESGHLLEINDSSIVGWCIVHKQARIALDVGKDTVRFNNPLLPLTRSEMALPLIVGNDVIGALSVQSAQEAAFEEKDINTLQVMADQLAIVINNAQLLSNLRETHRELLRTKTFEAIATATGEAIHWVGNKAAPIPACVSRAREDMARLIYMAEAILRRSPEGLRRHLFAQMIADAAETLDEKMPAGRELIAGLEERPFKSVRRLLSMESILEDLDIIGLSAQTILNIKEDLIGPARESQRRRIHLDELLKNVVTSMAISPQVHVEQRYTPALPSVVGDPRQLENVFGNLLKNAVEAMAGRPEQRLTLTAAPSKTEGFVEVRVADTGCGIPQSDLERIWISFYTTKGDRGGTGLGLSACMQIVNQMEGKIEVQSQVNVGTTFIVSLPRMAE